MDANLRTGGHILIEQLALHNADTVFGVPGESFLAALDGMHQSQRVRFINARHEGGAAMMADAYGKLTGRPGIAFATRGPGATNASAGVHVAFQDSTPMILLLGQVGRDMMEREAFQEIDYRQMFGPMSKWVAQIDDARRIPEFISRAFFTATSGRPGPVVLALPEDMLTDTAEVPDAPPYTPLPIAPDDGTLQQFHALLSDGATRHAAISRRLHRRMKCLLASRSAARIISTICIPAMAAISVSGSTQRSPSGSAPAIW
jgi:acetolactate synthase-1/2/3 large subunit